MADIKIITLKNGCEVTEAQYIAMTKLVLRYQKEPDRTGIEFGYGALMCVFDGLVVGIEKNGYAHT